MPQSEYEKEIPKIDWWTASEYEDWIATQKTELEALIGTGDGWYDGQGVFHEWTQDSVNAQIAEYEKILDEIKSGTLYSKDNDEGIGYAQIPPDGKDIVSVYGANFVRSDGSSFHIGDFASISCGGFDFQSRRFFSSIPSKAFTEFCESMNITQSMSKAGYPYDNAPMERYFNTLKNECTNLYEFETEEALYQTVDDFSYVEYNYVRPHSYNGYATPHEARVA